HLGRREVLRPDIRVDANLHGGTIVYRLLVARGPTPALWPRLPSWSLTARATRSGSGRRRPHLRALRTSYFVSLACATFELLVSNGKFVNRQVMPLRRLSVPPSSIRGRGAPVPRAGCCQGARRLFRR